MDSHLSQCYGDQGSRLAQLFQLASQGTIQAIPLLITGESGIGKTTSIRFLADHYGFHVEVAVLGALAKEFQGDIAAGFRRCLWRASKSSRSILLIEDLDLFCPREGDPDETTIALELLKIHRGNTDQNTALFMIATSRQPARIATEVATLFQDRVALDIPTQAERLAMLRRICTPLSLDDKVDLVTMASRAHAFVAADLEHWYRLACEEASLSEETTLVTQEHFDTTFHRVRPTALQDAVAEKPAPVHWTDIGGLQEAKGSLDEAMVGAIRHADDYARLGIRPPKGILLHGPPGTGKTLLAKAVATESDMNFLPIRIPDLIKSGVGESERAIARIFATAVRCSPCIIFMDELEAMFSSRQTSGDVGYKMISQLLIELDQLDRADHPVILLGATNRLDAIDTSLLRPGRLERLVFVGPPSEDERLGILQVIGRSTRLSEDVDLAEVARLTPHFTGADLKGLLRKAGIMALKRCDVSQTPLSITQEDIALALHSLNNLVP